MALANLFISLIKKSRMGTSLVSQWVTHLPPMQETRVRSLSWEDPLEKGTASRSSILA